MCAYCEKDDPLNSVADKWLFNENIDVRIADLHFGGIILPDKKILHVEVVSDGVDDIGLLNKPIEIKCCPMCGREL